MVFGTGTKYKNPHFFTSASIVQHGDGKMQKEKKEVPLRQENWNGFHFLVHNLQAIQIFMVNLIREDVTWFRF